MLSPTLRQITHALLTRPPLETKASFHFPFDVHVLGIPPAFVLSQDQTLNKEIMSKKITKKMMFNFQGTKQTHVKNVYLNAKP